MRIDNRQADEIRKVEIIPNYIQYPEGSVLISAGNTRVLCNVTIEDMTPRWMQRQGIPGGWITAEYALLPRSTQSRITRENAIQGGRSQEIRRLIGRSLRAAINLEQLGNHTCTVDCDVLQADGGTRSAAITGSYVALVMALNKLIANDKLRPQVFKSPVAAVSAGVIDGVPLLDLNYQEDSQAEVDVNVVMNARGEFIEIQGTAEGRPFPRPILNQLLDLAGQGIQQLLSIQQKILDGTL